MRNRKASLPVFGVLIVGGVFFLIGDGAGSRFTLPRRPPQPVFMGSAARRVPEVPRQKLIETYGKLPLSFEPCVEANCGDTNGEARFLSRGPGYTLFLTATEAVLALGRNQESEVRSQNPSREQRNSGIGTRDPESLNPESRIANSESRSTVLRMKLVGANPAPRIAGIEPLPGKSNYFIGNDPSEWRTNVPTYAKVKYEDVYPGIDLVYYGNPQQLEYDFVVAPGADPNTIRIAFDGADKLEVDAEGDLVAHIFGEELRLRKPVVYQETTGTRQEIPGGYVLQGKNQVGFHLANFDASRPLLIDPVLVYSRRFGGSGTTWGYAISVDEAGSAYIVGSTAGGLSTTTGAFQTEFRGTGSLGDVFIAKLNSAGDSFVYCTYLGGTVNEGGSAIAVDGFGNAYVTGLTQSQDFPTTPGVFQTSLRGTVNAFVTKLNGSGSALVYSTYIGSAGGRGSASGAAIAVDSSGNVYVGGATASTDFPTTDGAFQRTYRASSGTAFVSKLSSNGSGLLYSTLLGGSVQDQVRGIAVDLAGNAYVGGETYSLDFPTTPGAFETSFLGSGYRGFVSKLNQAGTALSYSTFLSRASVTSIAVDRFGNAYVTGADYENLPTTLGAFQRSYGGKVDAFVAKINSAGSYLIYATYLGGNDFDAGGGIVIDASGNAYVTGETRSTNFPITGDAYQKANGGGSGGSCGSVGRTPPGIPIPCSDAFVAVLNPVGSDLLYSTYIGGNGPDSGRGISVDSRLNTYVTGEVNSDFRTTIGSFESGHVLAVRIAMAPPVVTPGGIANGASFASGAPVAPGSIASAFGNSLSSSVAGGLIVRMNGVSAFVFDSFSQQINFQVPWELAAQPQASLTVTVNGATSSPVTVSLATYSPGIFTTNSSGNGQGAILIANTGEVAAPSGSIPGRAARPVNRGDFITIYCTGLGPVTNQPATGVAASGDPPSLTTTAPTVSIGSVPATVSFSGLAPGFVGLNQVNVQVPDNAPTGDAVPVSLTIGGTVSNSVTIAVQ